MQQPCYLCCFIREPVLVVRFVRAWKWIAINKNKYSHKVFKKDLCEFKYCNNFCVKRQFSIPQASVLKLKRPSILRKRKWIKRTDCVIIEKHISFLFGLQHIQKVMLFTSERLIDMSNIICLQLCINIKWISINIVKISNSDSSDIFLYTDQL